ncbi:MAG TPA: L-rhamnose/proton symporter RhaT [Cytophagaceae bacterium]|jgi:L-rhamnose-H+ transport protein
MKPILGTLFHAVGGLAAASFYIPYSKVKDWPWELYWLVGGIFAWLVAPFILITVTLESPLVILTSLSIKAVALPYIFGLLWGVGGLTFGLTMRYLGVGLGMAIALGLTAVFGTLIPPIANGLMQQLVNTTDGQITLIGIFIGVVGIAVVGRAGIKKDKELGSRGNASILEFNLKKGMLVAFFSGIMSACFAFGIAAGEEIVEASKAAGSPPLFVNSLLFGVIMLGGLTVNVFYCMFMLVKKEYFKTNNIWTPGWIRNLVLCIVAGFTWYSQFLFYGMGSTQMGEYDFASWSLHMSFIIILSNAWGLKMKEWKGVSNNVGWILISGLIVLIISTIIIGSAQLIAK